MKHKSSIGVRRSLFSGHSRKKLVVLGSILVLLLWLPSTIHRTPSMLHRLPSDMLHEIPPPSMPTETSVVFDPFPFPEELKTQVDFWRKIFTKYTTKQAVIHDNWYVNVIYEVIDIESSEFSSEKEGREALKRSVEKYKKLLQNVSQKRNSPQRMTKEERRLYTLLKDIPESSFFKKKDANDRVRAQFGQADRVEAGIIRVGQYLPAMKRIFAEYDLPENLVYLPLIESTFNPMVESYAGAAGMWQFMRRTGKEYDLTINYAIDERRDPLKSTRAAAQLLAHNYEVIQSWPLAITAYNFGLQGIKNAVKKMKTDNIVEIIEQYQGPRFGFASRNFYVEFLTAVDVCLRYTEYFGELEIHEPLTLAQVALPDYVSVKTLGKYSPLTTSEIKKLNPALRSSVYNRGGFIPKKYELNIPEEHKGRFTSWYAAIPKTLKYQYLPVKAKHRVKKGQTLSVLAKKYKTSVKAIMKTNGIKDPRKVRAGQVLKIPGGYVTLAQQKVSETSRTSANSQGAGKHKVKKGQTLSTIAERYHTSVRSLATLNGINDPQNIKAGQMLKIPSENIQVAQKTTSHRVKEGQSLWVIAKMHNTSVKAITKANAIKNPRRIKAGQVLKIPKG